MKQFIESPWTQCGYRTIKKRSYKTNDGITVSISIDDIETKTLHFTDKEVCGIILKARWQYKLWKLIRF